MRGAGFAFDNETPRHAALLQPYAIADRLVNCGEYAQFIADGGYQRPELWLSDGWAAVQAQGWRRPAVLARAGRSAPAPTTARRPAGRSSACTACGRWSPRRRSSQLSFYEAAAYADWAGARLPTEFEWEAALRRARHLADDAATCGSGRAPPTTPIPASARSPGVAAEYNGKFMVGQLVLRGGSVATPAGHARPSYRNFFPPAARWQFSGLRLAKDL